MTSNTKNQTMTPTQEFKLNAASTWIPMTMVVGIIGFVIYGTWQFSSERANIYGRIDQVSLDLKSLALTVERLADTISKPNGHTFSKQEWVMDCLRIQIANPTWKCPYADQSSDHMKGTH